MTSSDGKFSHGLTKGTQERKRACQVQGLESAKANQRATKLADLLGQEGLYRGAANLFLKGQIVSTGGCAPAQPLRSLLNSAAVAREQHGQHTDGSVRPCVMR